MVTICSNDTQTYYLQCEIGNQYVMSQGKGSTPSAPHFWHWSRANAQERQQDSPSYMKFYRVWIINWKQILPQQETKPIKTPEGDNSYYLSVFFHVCWRLMLNSKRMGKKTTLFFIVFRAYRGDMLIPAANKKQVSELLLMIFWKL